MNKEFHYWITGMIAHAAGFNNRETTVIAHSSQLVDDNDNTVSVFDDEMSLTLAYQNQVSQTMNILLPRRDLMNIYPLFHFIPGDYQHAPERVDQKTHLLNTTPNSANAQAVLQDALNAFTVKDTLGLYRLGIATHAFADTWAHQNFTGSWEAFNDMGNLITPDAGHADALHHPDLVSHRWTDNRLKEPEISNNIRFMNAAKCLYDIYQRMLTSSGRAVNNTWQELEEMLLAIFGSTYSGSKEKGIEGRVAQYRAFVPFLPDYDESAWQFSALESKMVHTISDGYEERYFWKPGVQKETTDWYRFQESVKAHVVAATNILKPLFVQAGIVA